MHKDISQVLYTQEEITLKCQEIGKQITEDYQGRDLVLVGLLKGSVPFIAELSKYIDLDVTFDYMDVSSYAGAQSGSIAVKKDLDHPVAGKDILIVEDILDTGKTLTTVCAMLMDHGARSVEIATLLDKKEARKLPIQAKYVGYVVPNSFIVGFGLDYNEKYRNLPYVGILKEEIYK